MFKKLILLSIAIVFALSGCEKDEVLTNPTTEFRKKDTTAATDVVDFCGVNANLGTCIEAWDEQEYPILEVDTINIGTSFYNVQIGETTTFDLKFSTFYSGNIGIVGTQLTVDGADHLISVEGNSISNPSVTLELTFNEPKTVELTILSTDSHFLYEREINFNLTLTEEEIPALIPDPNNPTWLCLEFDFGDSTITKVCEDDSSDAISILIPRNKF